MSARDRLQAAVKSLQDFSNELDKKDALSGEDIATLKARMTEVSDLKAGVTAEAARGQMDDAKSFLASLAGNDDTKGADPIKVKMSSGLSDITPKGGQTLGDMFVQSGEYKSFLNQYAKAGVIPQGMKGIQSAPFQADLKALVTGASDTSGGAYVTNDRYGQTVDLIGERELSIANLVTRGTTGSDTVEYVRVTGKTNNAAQVAEATTAAAGAISGASPGPYAVATPSGYKPESGLALEVVSTAVKTTAHWIPITKRAASDAGQMRTMIDNFLRYGLDEKLEDGILNGNGSGENFSGINNAGIQTVGSAGTDIDAVVDAIAAIRVTGRRRPTGIVVNPGDWYSTSFLTAKDSQNRYLIGDPRASIDQLNTLWGLQVVVSEAQPQNTLLVGDFRQAVLWNREGVNVLVSDQHSDFFVRNLLAILAERRDAFGILDPQAFCSVTAV